MPPQVSTSSRWNGNYTLMTKDALIFRSSLSTRFRRFPSTAACCPVLNNTIYLYESRILYRKTCSRHTPADSLSCTSSQALPLSDLLSLPLTGKIGAIVGSLFFEAAALYFGGLGPVLLICGLLSLAGEDPTTPQTQFLGLVGVHRRR